MSTLVVYLNPATTRLGADYDYVLSADGTTVTQVGRAAGALLPQATEVVAVLAVQALSWHVLHLPKGSLSARGGPASARLRSVLDGLLEEQLLDEPQQLHFALAPYARADAPVTVVACQREALRQALSELEAVGRTVARIVPELAPHQDQSQTSHHVLAYDGQAQWVSVSPLGVCCLPLTAASVTMARRAFDPERHDLQLWVEPALAAQAEHELQQPLSLLQREQRWLEAAQSPWDLAQFDLVSSGQARVLKRIRHSWLALSQAPQWRALRWGLALLVMLHIVGLNTWAWHEQQQLRAQQAELTRILSQSFPNVRVVLDAPLQMARELVALQRRAGALSRSDLEALLSVVATAVPSGRTPSGIDFANEQLRLKGLALTAAESTLLVNRLKDQNISARPDGADWLLTTGVQP